MSAATIDLEQFRLRRFAATLAALDEVELHEEPPPDAA